MTQLQQMYDRITSLSAPGASVKLPESVIYRAHQLLFKLRKDPPRAIEPLPEGGIRFSWGTFTLTKHIKPLFRLEVEKRYLDESKLVPGS